MIDPHAIPLATAGGSGQPAGIGALLEAQAAHLERRMVRAIVDHEILFVRAHDDNADLFADFDQRLGAADELFAAAGTLGLPWRGRERVEKIAKRIIRGRALKARREADALLGTPASAAAPEKRRSLGDARDAAKEARILLASLEVGYVEE